ncbi:hypothetical protein [Peribacillus frigoritolerans]|uniref:hypothetical protein n=1 Tax=Peribacillus frigoritolerans TaxID=450367 RepID=UPI000FDCD9CD|nr:hypothetical protein [Peribacillus frigoritolerans]AZV60308.1 hypothetical protein DOZ91_06500 [Peribacillus frigoritolerans]
MNKQEIIKLIESIETPEEKVESLFRDYRDYRIDERPFKEKNPHLSGVYITDELKDKIDILCEGTKRGFKNYVLYYAIQDFIERYGEEIKKHNS